MRFDYEPHQRKYSLNNFYAYFAYYLSSFKHRFRTLFEIWSSKIHLGESIQLFVGLIKINYPLDVAFSQGSGSGQKLFWNFPQIFSWKNPPVTYCQCYRILKVLDHFNFWITANLINDLMFFCHSKNTEL